MIDLCQWRVTVGLWNCCQVLSKLKVPICVPVQRSNNWNVELRLTLSLVVIFSLIIILSGDVELNPGPPKFNLDVEAVVKALKDVIYRNYAHLSDASKNCLKKIAEQMYSKDLITKSVKESPTFDSLISELETKLQFSKTVEVVEDCCYQFVDSLSSQGGVAKAAAQSLAQQWKDEIHKKFDVSFLGALAEIEPQASQGDVELNPGPPKYQLTSKPEIAQLMEWLDLLVSWKAFGLYLPGITYNTISKIDVDEPSVSEKKIALYIKWLKVCPTATWSDVITALQRMKEYTLAEDIKQKLQFKKTSQDIEHTDVAVSDISGRQIGKLSYSEEDLLGEGSYGTSVYKGWLESKREVAIKKISFKDYSILEEELMIKCDSHANLIRYYCKEEDDKHCYLALDLCKCSLYKYVNGEVKVSIGKFQILKDVMEGLKFLHSKGIIHRDIKPANILLTDTKAIITDFGISRKLQGGHHSKTTTSRKGSDGWIAPEMYKDHQRLTLSVDIFSMGCLIYYVLTNGQHPFGDTSCLFNIITNKYSLAGLDALDGKIKETAKPLIEQMINYDPTRRPPVDDVIDHCLFWDKKRLQCEFKDIIGQRVQDKNDPVHHVVVAELNRCKHDVFNGDWKNYVDVELCKELTKRDQPHKQKFEYDGTLLSDLIRAIRNKITHFGELPEEVKAVFDNSNEGVVPYFTSLFPSLLIVLYETKRTLIKNGQI